MPYHSGMAKRTSSSQKQGAAKRVKEQFRYRPGIPRTGWLLMDTFDNRTADFVCQNCKFPHVRYVHELKYKKTSKRVRVGCVCAQHLTEDFATPRLRETALKGRASRRMRWPTLNWKRSAKGNLYLKKGGVVIVVKCGQRGGWSASYKSEDGDPNWIQIEGWHDTPEEAKLVAFDALYPA